MRPGSVLDTISSSPSPSATYTYLLLSFSTGNKNPHAIHLQLHSHMCEFHLRTRPSWLFQEKEHTPLPSWEDGTELSN